MITFIKDNFSIRQICESGQCFRLRKLGFSGNIGEKETGFVDGKERNEIGAVAEKYGLTAFGRYLEIEQKGNEVSFDCTQEEFEHIWKRYFDLEEDYGKMLSSIDEEDEYLMKAAAFGSGIRILRQELWETIISFIISQQNNIKRIRKCIDFLCSRYGEERKTVSGKVYFDFPNPQALADAALEDLYACNLGYRSRYVHDTALSVLKKDVDLKGIEAMEYGQAKAELMKLRGVGVKVAECICLFALHKTEAFPIDTHINKVLARQYPEGFPFHRYKGYEGTLQQYIFYYDLKKGNNKNLT